MALLEDHLAKFHKMTDAKEMWEAIKSRFSRNDESKKMQKYILKQQFKGFSVSNSEGLHKGYDRTKPGVDSLSFDDLYNNIRVFESDVKGSTTSSSSTQNVAFVSENTSSINDVAMISMRMKKFYKKTGRKLQFDAKEPVGFDKTKVGCYSCHKTGHFARECRSKGKEDSRRRDTWNTGNRDKENGRRSGKQEDSKALVTLDGEGIDWTSHSEDEQENYALMACSSSGSDTEEKIRFMKIDLDDKTDVLTYHKKLLAEAEKEKEDLKAKVEKWHNSSKNLNILLNSQMSAKDNAGLGEETHESMPVPVVNEPKVESEPEVWSDAPIIEEYESDSENEHSPKPDKKDYSGLMSKKLGLGFGYTKKACFVCGSFSHLIRYCDFHEKMMAKQAELNNRMSKGSSQREIRPVWNNVQRMNHQNQFVPKAVLTRTGKILVNTARTSGTNTVNTARYNFNKQAVPINAARKVNTVKPIVNNAIPKASFHKSVSSFRKSFNRTTTLRTNFSKQKVNTAETIHKELYRTKGLLIVDSGCSMNMTRNKAYLAEYQDFNGGPVAFGGSKGYITAKEEQGFFTDSECLVLSPEFELPDENQRGENGRVKDSKALMTLDGECVDWTSHSEDEQENYALMACNSSGSDTDQMSAKDKAGLGYGDQMNKIVLSYENEVFQSVFVSRTSDIEDSLVNDRYAEGMHAVPPPMTRIYIPFGPDKEIDDSQFTYGPKQSKPSESDARSSDFNSCESNCSKETHESMPEPVANEPKVVSKPKVWSDALYHCEYESDSEDEHVSLQSLKDKHDIILVQVYVDDIIFGSTKKSWCDEFEALMKSRFQMSSMGELTFFLGLQVKQKADGIFISQDKYVAEILKKFDFVNVKTASTPIETQKPLVKDEEASDVDVHLYRSMIGSLMYLTASRPDIMFAVCACSRFQVTPKTSHLSAVKRIFRYLKGKPKLGLWYPRVSSFDLEAYSDSDYAGANLDRKSTTGGCQFLGRRLISWQCKKQTIMATSTTEVEYVAAINCCRQVLWIQNQMLDNGFNFMNTNIYIDNESTICIVKNPLFHSKTKHIAIMHHFIRDAYEKKLIQVLKIHTDDNVADLLTKAFNVSRFQFLVVTIGMIN
ncbi:putative ribonuclease H-like domain-containing protein [Tanacetum coccineum]